MTSMHMGVRGVAGDLKLAVSATVSLSCGNRDRIVTDALVIAHNPSNGPAALAPALCDDGDPLVEFMCATSKPKSCPGEESR